MRKKLAQGPDDRMARLLESLALFVDGDILGGEISIEFLNVESDRVISGLHRFQFGQPIAEPEDDGDEEPFIVFE